MKLTAYQHRIISWILGVAAMCVSAGVQAVPPTPLEFGYKDFGFPNGTGGDNEPSGEKVEHKLWYNDANWWSVMWSGGTGGSFKIHQLTAATQEWVDTGAVVDSRLDARFDTLWDGAKLYIVSHRFAPNAGGPAPTAGDRGRLYRYSYVAGNYVLDFGFPVDVNNAVSETLSMAKDAGGRLWVTWVEDRGVGAGFQVWVNHSVTGDDDWGDVATQPFVVPGPALDTTVTVDDISAVVALGSSIGVMWSDQDETSTLAVPNRFKFAAHPNAADPALDWTTPIIAVPFSTDDHINLKVYNNKLYAALKMSQNNHRIVLAVCDLAVSPNCSNTAAWFNDDVYRDLDPTDGVDTSFGSTKPILLINSTTNRLYLFTVSNDTLNGVVRQGIYYKTVGTTAACLTSQTLLCFNSTTLGMPFIRSTDTINDEKLNAPTSTRDSVTDAMGLAVLASSNGPRFYAHNHSALITNVLTVTTAAPSVTGEPVTIDFAVTGNSGTPTGTVTVSDGTQSCMGTLSGGVGSCMLTFTAAGIQSLSGSYGGSTTYGPSTASAMHTVNQADTTLSITGHAPDPSLTSEDVTVTLDLSVMAPGAGSPTGTVVVNSDGGTPSCVATLPANSCTLSFGTPGTKSLTAVYSGDANYAGSNAAVQMHTVNTGPGFGVSQCDFGGDLLLKCDILFHHTGNGSNLIWRMNNAGKFGGMLTSPAGLPVDWLVVGVGDVDADGDPDIVFKHKSTGKILIWFMKGRVKERGQLTFPASSLSSTWVGAGVGDFDGDGHADLLFRNKLNGKILIWFMNGAQRRFGQLANPSSLPLTYQIGGVGDFSGDGKADIAFRNINSGANLLWLMNGNMRSMGKTLPKLPDLNFVLGGVSDVDGDSDGDLLFKHKLNGNILIWFMDGVTFGSSTPTTPPSLSTSYMIAN